MARRYILHQQARAVSPSLRQRSNLDRDLDTLLGLCAGIIADDQVAEAEVHFLKNWIETHPEVTSCFPGNHLAAHLSKVFEDGVVDEAERRETLTLLRKLVGSANDSEAPEGAELSSTLPLTDPAPSIVLSGATLCLTGTFVYGKRKECEAAATAAGATCKKNVTKSLDALVLGTMVTPAWKHQSYGRKIEAALGYGIPIISEAHWSDLLPD